MSAEIFVSMDVSHACGDVTVHPGTAFQIQNDERGIAHAVEGIVEHLESTAGMTQRGRPNGETRRNDFQLLLVFHEQSEGCTMCIAS